MNKVISITAAASLLALGTVPASASTFGLMFESEADRGAGQELAFLTYAAFDDLVAGTPSSQAFSATDVSASFDTMGITWGGSQFVTMFESVADRGAGQELAFLTYATFDDLVAGTPSSQAFSATDVSASFDTTGITWDGSQFVTMFESVTDRGSGQELAFLTYATFDDLVAGTPSSQAFSATDVSASFDTTGITWDGSQFVTMFESVADRGSGQELAFLTYATFDDLVAGTPSSQAFSATDVSGSFSTTGIYSLPEPGEPPPSIPLPASAWLLGAALLLLGAAARGTAARS